MRILSCATIVAAALLAAPPASSAQEDYVVLKAFADTGPEGGNPLTGLMKASDGNLYGSLSGAVFRLEPNGTVALINRQRVFFDLMQARDGNLYGSTQSEVYRIALSGETTLLTVFADTCIDGLITGPLVEGDDGNFYGVARSGCSTSVAARVFRISPSGVVSTVYRFPMSEQVFHQGLTKARDGGFYGTTQIGVLGHGSVFKLTPGGSFTTLHTFTGGLGGSAPSAAVIEGRDGSLYGTTLVGGIGHGTVFRFAPGGDFTVLHIFLGYEYDGIQPRTTLLEASDGNLYGTAQETIFRVTPTGQFRVLHRASSIISTRYGFDLSALVEGDDGNFYGTAGFSGPGQDGVVFRLNRNRSACANVVSLVRGGIPPDESVLFTQLFKTETLSLAGAWLVSETSVSPLWFGFVPPITPTIMLQHVLDVTPTAPIGIFSFVVTSDSHVCSDWSTVNTGAVGFTQEYLWRSLMSNPLLAKLLPTLVMPQRR